MIILPWIRLFLKKFTCKSMEITANNGEQKFINKNHPFTKTIVDITNRKNLLNHFKNVNDSKTI